MISEVNFDSTPLGARLYEMGSARQPHLKPAAGGRFDVAVVDGGKLLLFA